jgi:hypothetical protein
MKSLFVILFTIGIGLTAKAREITSTEIIGMHHRLFSYEKNENNQNILVAYTQLENNCQIRKKNGLPIFDYYWLMNRQRYKPVAPLIRRKLRQRLEIYPSPNPDQFEVQLKDLRELDTNLKSITVQIHSFRDPNGFCSVKATLPKPDNSNMYFKLETIYAEAQRTWNPLDRKLISVALKGTDEKTGAPFTQELKARKK